MTVVCFWFSIIPSGVAFYCCFPLLLLLLLPSVVGVSSGITTFVGQAHGASQAAVKGVILQRGVMIALLTALLPLLAWTWAEGMLTALGEKCHRSRPGACLYLYSDQ